MLTKVTIVDESKLKLASSILKGLNRIVTNAQFLKENNLTLIGFERGKLSLDGQKAQITISAEPYVESNTDLQASYSPRREAAYESDVLVYCYRLLDDKDPRALINELHQITVTLQILAPKKIIFVLSTMTPSSRKQQAALTTLQSSKVQGIIEVNPSNNRSLETLLKAISMPSRPIAWFINERDSVKPASAAADFQSYRFLTLDILNAGEQSSSNQYKNSEQFISSLLVTASQSTTVQEDHQTVITRQRTTIEFCKFALPYGREAWSSAIRERWLNSDCLLLYLDVSENFDKKLVDAFTRINQKFEMPGLCINQPIVLVLINNAFPCNNLSEVQHTLTQLIHPWINIVEINSATQVNKNLLLNLMFELATGNTTRSVIYPLRRSPVTSSAAAASSRPSSPSLPAAANSRPPSPPLGDQAVTGSAASACSSSTLVLPPRATAPLANIGIEEDDL